MTRSDNEFIGQVNPTPCRPIADPLPDAWLCQGTARDHGGMRSRGSGPIVRRARIEDAGELTRLRTLMCSDMGRDPRLLNPEWRRRNIEHFQQRLVDADLFAAFVIGQDPDEDRPGQPLAACAVGWLNPLLIGTGNHIGQAGYIGNTSTDPGFRRRGYGRRTLTALLDWMRSTGISTVDLHATSDGEHLYRTMGFAEPTHRALTLHLNDSSH